MKIVGRDEENKVVFVDKADKIRKVNKFLKEGYQVVEVGRVFFLDYLRIEGCSPMFRRGGAGLTAQHCVVDLCGQRGAKYSDGSEVVVVRRTPYKFCRSWICGIFDRFFARMGIVWDRCTESVDADIAYVDRYNDHDAEPVAVLFGGSSDGRLALLHSDVDVDLRGRRVRIISYDYYERREVEWEDVVRGRGVFLVYMSENMAAWFDAYYIYPAAVFVKPGFSGSNVFFAA